MKRSSTTSASASNFAARTALVALAAGSVLGQVACSASGAAPQDEPAASTQEGVIGVDDVVAVYTAATAAYEAYNKITGYLQTITGTKPDPNAAVISAISGLSAQMSQLQNELNQVNNDLKNLIWAELQNFWDERVSKANGARALADTASAQLADWHAGGMSNATLLSQADDNSRNAANVIKDDATLFSRPAATANAPEVFEYRMALPQYLYAVTVRMAVIAAQHPQLATESSATAGPVRAELAAHAARLTAVIGQATAGVFKNTWSTATYDSRTSTFLVCTSCVEPLSSVQMGAGGNFTNPLNPTCEGRLYGTAADMNTTLQRDAQYNNGWVYGDTGLLAAMQLRDLATATSQPGFFGPAGQFLYPRNGTAYGFYGTHGNLAGDIAGDGYADVVGLGDGYVGAQRNMGKPNAPLTGYETWWGGSFYGSHGTFLADVDGDKKADLVGIGDGYIGVIRSTGTGFGNYETWSTDPSVTAQVGGWHGTLVGDMNGDGKADLVTMLDRSIVVSYSDGTSFGTPYWASAGPFYGTHGTYFADVDGDKKADLVALGDGFIGVLRSDGTTFHEYETWWGGSFYGDNGATYLGDVDGDGRADLVGLGAGYVGVVRSQGTTFGPYETWFGDATSSHGSQLADVDNDGRADLIGFRDNNVVWQQSANAY
jgi:hypothetical protein